MFPLVWPLGTVALATASVIAVQWRRARKLPPPQKARHMVPVYAGLAVLAFELIMLGSAGGRGATRPLLPAAALLISVAPPAIALATLVALAWVNRRATPV